MEVGTLDAASIRPAVVDEPPVERPPSYSRDLWVVQTYLAYVAMNKTIGGRLHAVREVGNPKVMDDGENKAGGTLVWAVLVPTSNPVVVAVRKTFPSGYQSMFVPANGV